MTRTITDIRTTPFKLPMHGTLRWGAHSALSEAHHVLVEVQLSDGAVGQAEALPRPTIYGETVNSICDVIKNELLPRVKGQPAAFEYVLPLLHQVKNNQTAKGAIDMALHDAVAQSDGVTLAEHLGATRDKVKVSYILGIGENDEVLAEAQKVYDQGVRVLKVKVGRDWALDIERIQLLTQIAPDLQLYADANETMQMHNAANRLEHLHELGVLYCEEPLPVEQVLQRSALQMGQHLPIIGDDSCFSLRDMNRELALDTFDILNIKCARTGFTESQVMLETAIAHGKTIMVGSQASSKLGMSRHAAFAAKADVTHPSELSFYLKMKEDIVEQQIPIKDGWLHLADVAQVRVT